MEKSSIHHDGFPHRPGILPVGSQVDLFSFVFPFFLFSVGHLELTSTNYT